MSDVGLILDEDRRRMGALLQPFNPITGEGSILERERVVIDDYVLAEQWLPMSMLAVPLVERIVAAGSIEKYLVDHEGVKNLSKRVEMLAYTTALLRRLRHHHDFAFWCVDLAKIENKEGGEEVPFCLNQPQRRLATLYERQRLSEQAIRAIILKARQWGGSTCTQIYMAWLQLVHEVGLNSLIIAHVLDTANNIKAMFHRLLQAYPIEMLYPLDEQPASNWAIPKWSSMMGSHNVHVIAPRKCKVQIGSAERPDSCRGEAHTLAHFSEVASWKRTEGKDPEDLVRSASAGILLKPLTMIVYESTAQRTGDFFHGEWLAAVDGTSQFAPLFVGWHEIEQYRLPLADKAAFARQLWEARESDRAENNRMESGRYLWWLWEQGATLEHIAWYVAERKKFRSHEKMAREYPTDAAEAFAHTQASVFSSLLIAQLRGSCKAPMWTGEIEGRTVDGESCMEDIRFVNDKYGSLWVWEPPEADGADYVITNRYLVVVDVGRGISDDADYSDIVVMDRVMMMDGGRPMVVAEWHGRIDIDLLAWKAAQIAKWYNNALLVIESNTIESNGGVGANMGDSSAYVLELIGDVYPNMYYREQSEEDIIKRAPRKIGFHTNRKTKRKVIEELQKAIRTNGYIERNEACLVEYEVYERNPNGSYGAPPGTHDDRLMTRGIGLYVCNQKMDLPQEVRRESVDEYRRRRRGQILNEAVI